ncbi:protein boule-like [Mirounga angustirostris]|uniref:protein boule-like n=1 Tax=Mirounga angustirostris TaxID=9716 RepID=UPI00313BFB73
METESGAQTSNQTQTDSLSPSPNPVSPVPLNNPTSAPRYGTVIPNRIFVGGIDFKTNENDLRKFFSQYGSVKEVKIVNDRAGVSKGYGFVTFETQEDAQKILQEAEKLNYKDKKLNIGPAIRKQQVGNPRSNIMPAAGTMYLTTSTGYPYTYHNGVAYFHTPEVTSVPPSWPSRSISSSPVMVAQPVYQQPTYHYQAPAQCLPGQWQWGVPQSPASSAPFLYLQPSEVIYQPVEIAQDGGCVPPPLSLMEASVPEPYSDHGVQVTYHQVYAPSAISMTAPVMQPEPIKVTLYHLLKLFQSDTNAMLGKKTVVSEFYDEMMFQDPTAMMQQLLTTSRQLTLGAYKHETEFAELEVKTREKLEAAKKKNKL